MLDAYAQKKDLYAIIAQQAFHNGYWDNMEHHEDGSPNPEGAKRRSIAKTILLGIMYGRGCASIAEQIDCTPQEAQKIIDTFYSSFPQVKEWVTNTEKDAKVTGYVEDYWGRRRRLPDLLKPKYSITVKGEDNTLSPDFNPLLGARGLVKNLHPSKFQKWQDALSKMKGRKDYEKIKMDAAKEDVTIVDNGAFIAQAERQCVNARIQGSAATLTKLAMIEVFNDDILKHLGFKLLIAVHDELIGECPIENADAVADRLCERMVYAAKKNGVDVPMKCDPEIEDHWYSNNLAANLKKDYKKKCEKMDPEKAYQEVLKDSLFLGVPNLEQVIKEGEVPAFNQVEESV